MKLPLLQPNITIKLPFQDAFIDVTIQNNTSSIDCFKSCSSTQLGLPFTSSGCNKTTYMTAMKLRLCHFLKFFNRYESNLLPEHELHTKEQQLTMKT
jgi:hypothetical protein